MRAPSRRTGRYGLPAVLATGLLVASCSGDAPEVRIETVGRETVAEVVEAPATVEARAAATVTSPADGTIAELTVADGQAVKAGQIILRVDSPAAQRALVQAQEADREAADAGAVTLPQADLDTAASDAADKAAHDSFAAAREAAAAIPDPDARARALAAVAQAEAQYAAARAQARQAVRDLNSGIGSLAEALSSLTGAQRVQTRAAVQIAQATVDALIVTAPIAGVVDLGGAPPTSGGTSLDAVPEELRGAADSLLGGGSAGGGTPVSGAITLASPVTRGQQLMTITDVSALSLRAEVDETDVLLVTPGVTAVADLDAVPGASYDAVVASVDVSPTASAGGGVSYVVSLILAGGTDLDGETAPTPRPGMSAVVELAVRTATDVVAVPASAVVRDGVRDAVWVVESGVVERRRVRVGAQGEELVEVLEGVREGEEVVVSGADRVSDGQRLG